jgi:DNA-binding protein HU-beta
MNKSELITEIALTTKFTKKEINFIITTLLELIITKVSNGEKITLVGFGSFRLHNVKSRNGINPRTREEIFIPASKKPIFSSGKFFKNKVNTLN